MPVLTYVYSAIIDIPSAVAEEAMQVAQYFGLDRLVEACQVLLETGWYEKKKKNS